ncbi:DNA-binding protein [Shewanella sp. 202IG2-18]|uniref:PPC domain-containing DNA-binding protein n=1 Tax=Parashewanella hymeniacidonis TaxID=2807618 RepID=UPI0019610368|nr:PPC domain-containing DNA-binding protein [Parashewanella hymeniacidonis]MBM7072822.1 DNA-binding protein [Parashewanella hymeniacidonis]
MKASAVRLKPGEDLKLSLEKFIKRHEIQAGCILTCVGSLKNASLRLANSENILSKEGPFEIVSLVGTFSLNGSHLHISISDDKGMVIGGHLLEGNKIFTTAEVVILELNNHQFTRSFDENTGFDELVIKSIKD